VRETTQAEGPPTYLLLGAAGVRSGADVRELRGRRQNVLFAMLALAAGTPVATGHLVETMWDDGLPTEPVGALQSQVSRLRVFLGGAVARGVGTYALTGAAANVDVHRFDALVRQSRQLLDGGAHALARQRVEQALSLWRGSPFPELAGLEFAAAETVRLDELRLEALVLRAQSDLMLGRTTCAVISLRALTAGYPLREDLWALLIRALYAGGRTAEALAAYRAARQTLVTELGLEPGPHLRGLEAAMLRHDPALAQPCHPCTAHAQLLGATPGPHQPLAVPQQAAQAFVDRVRVTLPGYDPAPSEAASIVVLVQLLDGDPFRIELAAAQLPQRSVDQLVRLHERPAGPRPGRLRPG
jgi:DNA-binding SARP family transcriptional activator